MAVIWSQYIRGKCYEVRRAGNSIRLYTDDIFHSQYNPRSPIGGNLWDLLFIPTFLHPQPDNIKRVLVLGVGGGAVIQQLNTFISPACIVGIELDPVHIKIARRFFNVKQQHVQLIEAEAQTWLKSYRGPKFDLIIEDLFIHSTSNGKTDPVRAITANQAWQRSLSSKLSHCGVLVMNFSSLKEFKASAFANKNQSFPCNYKFSSEQYENRVLAFLREPCSKKQFAERLAQHKLLDTKRSDCKLRFKIQC